MSKITRSTAQIFGSNAGTNQMAQFGSLAAAAPLTYNGSTITPAIVQALSNYLTGWFGAVVGGNSPAIEDMNALCYLFAYQIAYSMQAGVPEYDTGTTYYTGSLVNSNGSIYVSLTNNNLNNALTSATNWRTLPMNLVATVTAATYTATQLNDIILCNYPTGTCTVTLPAASTCAGKEITIKKIDSSTNGVVLSGTVDGNSGYTFNEQYESTTIVSDGSTWWTI